MNQPNRSPEEVSLLQRSLHALQELRGKLAQLEQAEHEPIAVVGMALRFPGDADSPDSFWRMLAAGVDAMTEVPADRWDVEEYYDPDPDAPGKSFVRECGFIRDVDQFDPAFFGVSKREAVSMDPQQRLLLEIAWEALEDAGIPPDSLRDTPTGVFVGQCNNDYAHLISAGNLAAIDAYIGTGVALSVSAGRINHSLGLQGPAITLDTACSSSLVAVDLGVQHLRTRKCDLVLAGGVHLILSPGGTIYMSKLKALSPSGRCRTFDAAADGYGRGEGCAFVVLKRLSDATTDGDRILAVVRGSAVNHDGRAAGLTVPNGSAQQMVIRQALANGQVDPLEVDYVEAHGTGTPLGDPIELRALGAVLCAERAADRKLLVGTVKTNIGHLEPVAGVAGLIKVILALRQRKIPPNLHFQTPSPHIPWDELSIDVPTRLIDWPNADRNETNAAHRPLAGVSAFGFSGTNSHVIVQAAPESAALAPDVRPLHLLPLSARTEKALRELAQRYIDYLAANPNARPGDVCYTASSGRTHFEHRLAVVGASTAAIGAGLQDYLAGKPGSSWQSSQVDAAHRNKLAMLFTGQGAQRVDMARELYESHPTFRAAIDRANQILTGLLPAPLAELLYPSASSHNGLLNQTACTQPALLAVEFALAELWRSWGIEPAAYLGHSVGQYAAACAAGVFDFETGLRLIAERGRLMQSLPAGGAMAAILAPRAQVEAALVGKQLSVAAYNGPEHVVVSGSEADVLALAEQFSAAGFSAKRLEVSHAFHSAQMDPILADFERAAYGVALQPPRKKIVCNLTGQTADSARLAEPSYWRRHLREPVEFERSIATLADQGFDLLLEAGPQPVLLGMARRCPGAVDCVAIPSLRSGRGDWQQMLESLRTLYLRGVSIDWKAFHRPFAPQLVSLPHYPFQRRRYWAEVSTAESAGTHVAASRTPLQLSRLSSPALRSAVFTAVAPSGPSAADQLVTLFEAPLVSPGTTLSLMIAAARQTAVDQPLILNALQFDEPLVVSGDTPAELQVVVDSNANGPSAVQFYSSTPPGASNAEVEWTRRSHAQWSIAAAALPSNQAKTDNPNLAEFSAGRFYSQLATRGWQCGADLRAIKRCWLSSDRAIAEFDGSTQQTSGEVPTISTGLLDACLQTLIVLDAAAPPMNSAYQPASIESVSIFRPASGTLQCQAVLRPTNLHDERIGDVDVVDADDRPVLQLRGIVLQRVPADKYAHLHDPQLDGWTYQAKWQPQPKESAAAVANTQPARCLFIAFGSPDIASVAKACGWAGIQCESYAFPAELDDELQFAAALVPLAARYSEFNRIVFLAAGTPSRECSVDELMQFQARLSAASLALLKSLASGAPPRPRLFVVTNGAQAVAANEPTNAALATLWGLMRVAALELHELRCTRIDLPTTPKANDLDELVAELAQPAREDQLAVRHATRYVSRLVRWQPDDAAPASKFPGVRSSGAYLVTGGLGALGGHVARWLAAHGATHLVLTGRSAPKHEALAMVESLRAGGARVDIVQADISDEADVRRLLADLRAESIPLVGVIHAAGLLDDGFIVEQSWPRFEKVMAPKVRGAWLLDQLTRDEPLDCFVLFSSVTSMLGVPGQSNYAAANAFLDALAHRRAAEGRTALAINWGAWAESGMAARMDERNRERMVAQGIQPILPRQGMQVFGRLLSAGSVQAGFAPMQWGLLLGSFPPGQHPPMLDVIASTVEIVAQPQAVNHRDQLLARLAVAPSGERDSIILEFVRTEATRVLGADPDDPPDVRTPLSNLGIDSLMAVELRTILANVLQRELPVSVVYDHPTVLDLARYFGQFLSVEPSPAAPPTAQASATSTATPPAETDLSPLAESLDEMSAESLAALLSERLRTLQDR